MKISLNGRIVEANQASVSVYDHGFLYGLGLFETFRTYKGVPFLLEEHMERLNSGLSQLGIRYRAESPSVLEEIRRLLQANKLEDAYIRYTVSAGSGDLGLGGSSYEHPTVVIYMKPLSLVEEWYTSGRSVQILNTVRPIPETNCRLKSFQYMNGWMAKQELMSYPWARGAEGVQLNEHKELTEGIVSNVFFIRQNTLHTPSLDSGALPGITRGFVLRIADQLGIRVEEGTYRTEDLWESDEIFLTNSIQEIVPVKELYRTDGMCKQLPGGIPGPVTQKFINRYKITCNQVGERGVD